MEEAREENKQNRTASEPYDRVFCLKINRYMNQNKCLCSSQDIPSFSEKQHINQNMSQGSFVDINHYHKSLLLLVMNSRPRIVQYYAILGCERCPKSRCYSHSLISSTGSFALAPIWRVEGGTSAYEKMDSINTAIFLLLRILTKFLTISILNYNWGKYL